jgi:hypothetical protein
MPLGCSRARLTVVAAVATMLLLAACDDASGPKSPAAAEQALHYDSLSVDLMAHDTTSGDALRAAVSGGVAGVAANGTAPQPVTVTVNGTSTTWLAAFSNTVDSGGGDSDEFVAVWSDANMDTVVISAFVDGDMVLDWSAVAGGDVNNNVTISNAAFAFGATSGTCRFTTISQQVAQALFWPTYDPSQSTCLPQSSTDHFTYVFGADTTTTGALASLTFPSQTVNGARLVYTTTNLASHVPPIAR